MCICIAGTQKVGTKCIAICLNNSFYNETTTSCQCNFGYVNISGICDICVSGQTYNSISQTCNCPLNQFFNTTINLCQCSSTFFNFSNSCVSICPSGYTSLNGICVQNIITCQTNQTLVNGKCECIPDTFLINGICTSCSSGKFYSLLTSSCSNCTTNCVKCLNLNSCI